MNKNKIFGRFILSSVLIQIIQLLFVSTTQVYAGESAHYSANHSAHTVPNFGSGDHYLHQIMINLSDHQHLFDIHRKADDIPRAQFRQQPSTHHIGLAATEVITPGISCHHWIFDKTVPDPPISAYTATMQ